MSIFRRKEERKAESCCGGACDVNPIAKAEQSKKSGARVKILGSGCKKCNELERNTKEALKRLLMDSTIDHITDFSEIASYGVMSTPALVVDGRVISFGKVLSTDEIANLINKSR